MTANRSIDPAQFLSEQLERAEPDLLRSMLKTFIDALMGAEADALCGAPYGARSDDRVNFRNGYRAREWDTRAGTMEVAIPDTWDLDNRVMPNASTSFSIRRVDTPSR